MKKVIALVVAFISLIAVAAAEGLEDIIPDASIWGISANDLKERYEANYEHCQVGEDEALRVSNVEVCSYNMDVYYVFDETTDAGLSKVAYILNVSDFDDEDELDSCLQTLIEDIKRTEGEPDTIKNTTNIWKNEEYKIEVGKGKLSKYTGSDNSTVAIIFKKVSKPKVTKTPKPTKTPRPTKTPKPTKSATLGEQNALASALSYLDYTAFSRKGLIEQLKFEGFSTSEAEYAVKNCGADWNEQAAKMARQYLEYTSFSRQGLIEQLEFEGFTHDQAVYGVKKVEY